MYWLYSLHTTVSFHRLLRKKKCVPLLVFGRLFFEFARFSFWNVFFKILSKLLTWKLETYISLSFFLISNKKMIFSVLTVPRFLHIMGTYQCFLNSILQLVLNLQEWRACMISGSDIKFGGKGFIRRWKIRKILIRL